MPRKPKPWFRFYTETITDRKIRRLPVAQRWLWAAILSASRESFQPGKLLIAEGMAMTPAELADYAAIPVRDVKSGLEAMQQMGMLTRENDVIVVTNWDHRQFESDDVTSRANASRQRSKEQRSNVATSSVATSSSRARATETENREKNPPLAPPRGAGKGTRLDPAWEPAGELVNAMRLE
jgi:hypothetical protein